MTNKYASRYSPDRQVTAAQYIAEYMCEHIATLDKIDLPTQFWNDTEWAKVYKREIVMCHKLLKMGYHPRALMHALKDNRCFRVYSLAAFWKIPRFKNILESHNKQVLAKENSTIEITEGSDVTVKPTRIHTTKRSKISKLKGL